MWSWFCTDLTDENSTLQTGINYSLKYIYQRFGNACFLPCQYNRLSLNMKYGEMQIEDLF